MGKTDKLEELILYIGILKVGKVVVASFGRKDVLFDKPALEASSDFPRLCKDYVMSFDEVMLAFLRDPLDSKVMYVMGCHSALTKQKALSLLSELAEFYSEAKVPRGIFHNHGLDPALVKRKLEQRMRNMIENNKGVIPPRQDLVIYKDAPDKFLVHKPTNEGEVSPDPVSPVSVSVPGRKSLQEELADLGDDESDVETPSSRKSAKPKPTPRGLPAVRMAPELPSNFPFLKAKIAKANTSQWSVRMSHIGVVDAATPYSAPGTVIGDPNQASKGSTWSMDFSAWAEKMSKGRADTAPQGPAAQAKPTGVPSTQKMVEWAKKRGELPEGLQEIIDAQSQGEKDESRSQSVSQSPPALVVESRSMSAEAVQQVDYRVPRQLYSSNDIQKQYKGWGNDNMARVSPEEGLHREVRTDVFSSRNRQLAFVSERAAVTPGRISAYAPSGLTWEEEIRRLQVAEGLAPPRKASAANSETSSEVGGDEHHSSGKKSSKFPAHVAVPPLAKTMSRKQTTPKTRTEGRTSGHGTEAPSSSFCCF